MLQWADIHSFRNSTYAFRVPDAVCVQYYMDEILKSEDRCLPVLCFLQCLQFLRL